MAKKIHKTINQFPVMLQEDEQGGYWVQCPVLQGCYSQGETIDEALKNIREAIALCLEDVSPKERAFVVPRTMSFHLVHV